MFRIRRILDLSLVRNQRALEHAQKILKEQFPPSRASDIDELGERIRNPFKDGFRHLVLVAEDPARKQFKGAAVLSHDPVLHFSYLDFIAVTSRLMGHGVGGNLYDAVRDEAAGAGSKGLFFECNPDEAALCRDPATLKENIARLRFYERYRARPIINTKWESPLTPTSDADDLPFLVFDDLDLETQLSREQAQAVARAVLLRKYRDLVSPEYVQMVVESFVDDPIQIRPNRYTQQISPPPRRISVPPSQRISLVVTSKHSIHHVRSKGYVESPVRVNKIVDELKKTDFFREVQPWGYPEKYIRAVHDADFVSYMKKMYERLGEDEVVYPYVFPIRNAARLPQGLPVQVGYYCIDTFTPMSKQAYLAARAAVDCSLTAAEAVLDGSDISYALVRPPGHHAERDSFGGFCYFNNAAIAAHFLSEYGKVALLDIDYHHGNGQQDIFYDRSDVLTVSIHCHPKFVYPHFTGFENETGDGPGKGFNLNIPLGEDIDGERHRIALVRALKRILNFKPRFLVVALGVDTAKGDPTGSWSLVAKDFELNGRLIGQLKIPTVVVQEGGYRIRDIGRNVAAFFRGLWTTMHAPEADLSVFAPQKRTSVGAASKEKADASFESPGPAAPLTERNDKQ
jgi:acetoin utilization deacetylase AcuC-like enzyme